MPVDIMHSADLFQELLAIRNSSDLFRLETGAEIQERVVFHNTGPDQIPGLVVMSISDLTAVDLDRYYEFIVVLVNANDETQSFTAADLVGQKLRLQLHDVQANSVDPLVQTASYNKRTGTFEIPGRTTAVFVWKLTPKQLIGLLTKDVWTLVKDGELERNKATVLLTKLRNAKIALSRGKLDQAIKQLEQFIHHVEILVRQGNLAAEFGDALIQEAKIIIEQIAVDYLAKLNSVNQAGTQIFLPTLNH